MTYDNDIWQWHNKDIWQWHMIMTYDNDITMTITVETNETVEETKSVPFHIIIPFSFFHIPVYSSFPSQFSLRLRQPVHFILMERLIPALIPDISPSNFFVFFADFSNLELKSNNSFKICFSTQKHSLRIPESWDDNVMDRCSSIEFTPKYLNYRWRGFLCSSHKPFPGWHQEENPATKTCFKFTRIDNCLMAT